MKNGEWSKNRIRHVHVFVEVSAPAVPSVPAATRITNLLFVLSIAIVNPSLRGSYENICTSDNGGE